jgi:hypothetical protein
MVLTTFLLFLTGRFAMHRRNRTPDVPRLAVRFDYGGVFLFFRAYEVDWICGSGTSGRRAEARSVINGIIIDRSLAARRGYFSTPAK